MSLKIGDKVIIKENEQSEHEDSGEINDGAEAQKTNLHDDQNVASTGSIEVQVPAEIFQLIEDNGLNVVKKLVFPDHYHFTKTEIEGISKEAKVNNYKIIMTEKDFFKIKKFNLIDIEYLKVVLEINKKNNLIDIINKSI